MKFVQNTIIQPKFKIYINTNFIRLKKPIQLMRFGIKPKHFTNKISAQKFPKNQLYTVNQISINLSTKI